MTPHLHDYVVIALSSINLQAAGASGKSYAVQLDAEQVQVIKGGWQHRSANLADTTAKLIEIDVSNGISAERSVCGPGPKSCTDGRFGKTSEGT